MRSGRIACEICHKAELSVGLPPETALDHIAAILPCGHVFGQKCIKGWLESNTTCPTCRFDLSYPCKRHCVPAVPINVHTILWIPKTIARGGRIQSVCPTCREHELHQQARHLYQDVSRFIRQSLPEHRTVGGEQVYAKLVAKAEAFAEQCAEQCVGPQRVEW
ncbi:hypothetical protein QBC39DRAFT_369253 [Podospora conica]|nr:hypothetical protein QBC39DRAFT_369253 [Schizothecium conicum]